MTGREDWSAEDLIEAAKAHDKSAQRCKRKRYARKRRLAFTARRFARKKNE